jgi:predicted RNase H-like nuclease (RuvC/YqgF family)
MAELTEMADGEPMTPAAGSSADAAGLADLAAAVHAASRRVAELRETNQQLSRRVRELEAQLAAAERGAAAGSGAAPGSAAADSQRAALQAERLEVRRRVEALTRRLDQLAAAAR